MRASFHISFTDFIAVEVVHEPGRNRREDPDQLRDRNSNLGKSWSAADEEKLLALYRSEQRGFEELATTFGWQPTAMQSRLGRFDLEQL